jgi:hypothetical protein
LGLPFSFTEMCASPSLSTIAENSNIKITELWSLRSKFKTYCF